MWKALLLWVQLAAVLHWTFAAFPPFCLPISMRNGHFQDAMALLPGARFGLDLICVACIARYSSGLFPGHNCQVKVSSLWPSSLS